MYKRQQETLRITGDNTVAYGQKLLLSTVGGSGTGEITDVYKRQLYGVGTMRCAVCSRRASGIDFAAGCILPGSAGTGNGYRVGASEDIPEVPGKDLPPL